MEVPQITAYSVYSQLLIDADSLGHAQPRFDHPWKWPCSVMAMQYVGGTLLDEAEPQLSDFDCLDIFSVFRTSINRDG